MSYKIDMHVHCSENSPCAPDDGVTVAESYVHAHYDGIVITNHFLNGHATDLSKIDWAHEANYFFKGYENAKAYGDAHGLDVFFGWEYRFGGADLLTYGLGREWLLAHPDMCSWDERRYADEVHAAGGFITHAHPFRESGPAKTVITLYPRLVDAVEVYNGSHEAKVFGPDRLAFNKRAEMFADSYGLYKLAGSDTHGVNVHGENSLPLRRGAVVFDRPFSDEREMIAMIRRGEYTLDCPELVFEELKKK